MLPVAIQSEEWHENFWMEKWKKRRGGKMVLVAKKKGEKGKKDWGKKKEGGKVKNDLSPDDNGKGGGGKGGCICRFLPVHVGSVTGRERKKKRGSAFLSVVRAKKKGKREKAPKLLNQYEAKRAQKKGKGKGEGEKEKEFSEN